MRVGDVVKAVLFDLDDTLYDHRHACTTGICAIRDQYPELQQTTVGELEERFWQMLEKMYPDVMRGRVTEQQSRRERIRALFAGCGSVLTDEQVDEAVLTYRNTYVEARRAIPGAIELLTWLREQGVRIGIVTNGLTHNQQDKMLACGLDPYVEVVVTADDAGCAKPKPAMFELALRRLGVSPQDALMIGDSWASDVIGAQAAGLHVIWYNRRGELCPDLSVATEIVELSELRELLAQRMGVSSS